MSENKTGYQVEGAASGSSGPAPVEWFRGEFAFLSNFFESPIELEGAVYPTAEHAFQAMKAKEASERYVVQTAPTPAAAKARGRKVTMREDWEGARFEEMGRILRIKFRDPELRARLLSTGDRPLIEGNTWRDTTWGAVKGKDGAWKGRNELGKLLMRIREELRAEEDYSVSENTATAAMGEHDAELIAAALEARQRAYAPYSKYSVGAALRMGDGRIVGGCNVENASYGLCNCAERTAVFRAIAEGASPVVAAVAVATEDGGTPCGACRQVLSEFAPRDGSPVPVYLLDREGSVVTRTTLADLLPMAFRL